MPKKYHYYHSLTGVKAPYHLFLARVLRGIPEKEACKMGRLPTALTFPKVGIEQAFIDLHELYIKTAEQKVEIIKARTIQDWARMERAKNEQKTLMARISKTRSLISYYATKYKPGDCDYSFLYTQPNSQGGSGPKQS